MQAVAKFAVSQLIENFSNAFKQAVDSVPLSLFSSFGCAFSSHEKRNLCLKKTWFSMNASEVF